MERHNPIVTEQGGRLAYMPQLDALRAFAIGLVFLSHWVDKTGVTGVLGVRLFFVLSGFLITSILLRTRSQIDDGQVRWTSELRLFYTRRFLRLFPALFLLIAALWLIDFESIRQTWPWHLTYLSNVRFAIQGRYESGVAVLWSLSVEEQFYIVWPLLILLAPRRFHKPAAIALTAFAFAWHAATWWFSWYRLWQYVLPFKWLDGLGVGSLLALLIEAKPQGLEHAGRFAAVAARVGIPIFIICIVAQITGQGHALRSLMLELSASLTFVWLVFRAAQGINGTAGTALSWNPLLYIGRISYGLYLYHGLVVDLFKWVMQRMHVPLTSWDVPQLVFDIAGRVSGAHATKVTGLIMVLIYFACSILVASVSWFAWEKPLTGFRRYFRYSRGLTIASATKGRAA